ncbi:uncharacterized protein [Lepisosteus oculatus]|uniref:uncharacterized protein n=1 Tax=Lepisosteus oculatus TaxID=7918 RepID=UPI0035F50D8E
MECESGFLSGMNGAHFAVCDKKVNGHTFDVLPNKRKRNIEENYGTKGCVCGANENQRFAAQETNRKHARFVSINGNRGVFYSECWKPNGSTLYLPFTNNILVNMDKYDQISIEEGSFFIGNNSGECLQKMQGHAMHCWRYNDQEKKLFIALSYFFVNPSVFQEVVCSLDGL